MSAIGGSIRNVSVKGRVFPVAADSDAGIKLGGVENEVQANGDGTARIIQTRMPWSKDGVSLSIDHDKDDLRFLQDVANSGELVPISLTLAGGTVFSGRGTIVGEIKLSTQNATAPIGFMGPGDASKQ